MGLGDLSTSTDFMKSILSGDPTKIAQVLGPQIRAIQEQGTQQKKTTAEFGNRGGGTNATNQRIGDTTRSQINDLISSLTGSSVNSLASTGSSLLSTGLSGFGTAFNAANVMQGQSASKWNDIFKSIGSVIAGAGAFPGVSKGFSQGANAIAGMFP